MAREGCTLTVLGGPAGTSSAVLVTDASLVSDIDASLVIEASSAVPEPRGVFIWMRRCRQSTFGTHAFRLNRDEHPSLDETNNSWCPDYVTDKALVSRDFQGRGRLHAALCRFLCRDLLEFPG